MPEVYRLYAGLSVLEDKEISWKSSMGETAAEVSSLLLEEAVESMPLSEVMTLFTVNQIYPGAYQISTSTNPLIAAAFIRFQEHYESPEFQGKIFSLEEYKEWFRQEDYATGFSYYADYCGFNIPDYVMQEFRDGSFDPLSKMEKCLVKISEDLPKPFYLIGTGDLSGGEALEHEIAHAFFYLYPDYREKVEEILQPLDSAPVNTALASLFGYTETVFPDETHAYLLDGEEGVEALELPFGPYEKYSEKLVWNFEEFKKKLQAAGA